MNFQFTDAHYVNTPEKLEALDAVLMDGDKPNFEILAVDTETNGLLFFKDVVIGFSVSFEENSGYYVPLLEWVPDKSITKTITVEKQKIEVYPEGSFVDVWTGETYSENVTSKEYTAPDVIKMLLRRWLLDSGARLVMHNAPFDCSMILQNFGVDLSQNLWADTILLKHVLDENTNHGLKETATLWKKELGINPNQEAKKEQLELGQSVIRNGGTFSPKIKHVWRGDGYMVAKYGASDTALTLGLLRVGLERFEREYSESHWKWFFQDEVMPVCREVVIPMLLGGVYIDVSYFEKLKAETQEALDFLEDLIQDKIKELLSDFNIGQSVDEAVSKKRLIERIIELEGLEYPTMDKRGEVVTSLSKKAIMNAYSKNPHWLWAYMLGQDEMKYDDAKLSAIKNELYLDVIKRRYRFNIRSNEHLRWLFCSKLGHDPAKLEQTDSATEYNPIASMNAEALEAQFSALYDFVEPLLCFKKLDKLMGSYILPALELNNNGWLHMSMKQHGTVSGRFACSGGFNLQTLPKVEELDKCPSCESHNIEIEKPIELLANLKCKDCGHTKELIVCPSAIKKGFVAPPGYKIVNADYNALEPRCFSHQSNDPKLKEVYQQGLDIYSKVYIDMLDREGQYSARPDAPNFLKKLNKSARDLFKPVCFIAGTRVLTNKGYIKIEEVKPGDLIWSKFGFKPVSHIMSRKAETLKLVTTRQVITCTPDHKIWSKTRNNWIEAQKLEVKEELEEIIPCKLKSNYQRLKINSNASFKNGSTMHLSEITFDENWAWLLGAFLGDGVGIYTRKKEAKKRRYNSHLLSIYVGICGLEHDGVVDSFRERLEKFGYKMAMKKQTAKTYGTLNTYMLCDFEIGKIFQETFKAIKPVDSLLGGKNLSIQNFVFNSPTSVKLAFLAGLLDTDGYLKVSKSKKAATVAICSKSSELASDIGQLLQSLDIKYTLNIQHNKTYDKDYFTVVLHASGKRKLKELGIDKFLICKRKRDAIIELFPSGPAVRTKEPYLIKTIPRNIENVFDVTVDEVHEFSANGLRVHNCLGIPYGARSPQVANLMNLKKAIKRKNYKTGLFEEVEVLDVEKGKEYRDLYLNTYAELKKYMDRQEASAISQGYVETLIGRRRHFQYAPFVYQLISKYGVTVDEFLDARRNDLKKDYALGGKLLKDGLYEFCSHYAIRPDELFEKGGWLYIRNQFQNELNNSKNVPIQGLAGHITNRAMLEVSRGFRENDLDAYVALQVHDEITVYAKDGQEQRASLLLKAAMEQNEFALKLDVPMIAEPIICNNLKDSK